MPDAAQLTRRLVVVRHARAADVAEDDHGRPLTEFGLATARDDGTWLAGIVEEPGHVVVSDALRTRQTWEALRDAAGWHVDADESAALYSASVTSALDLVREVPEETRTLVVVGHNPTVAILASLLDDGRGDPDASISLATTGFPPGSVAVFSFEGTWWDLRDGYARLDAYHVVED